MLVENPQFEQHVFRAELYRNGQAIENVPADLYTTRQEAEADGEALVADYDPEWQKRNPGQVEYVVREYIVDSVDDAGAWGGYTVD